MKTLTILKLTLYTFILLLITTCSDDDKIQHRLTTQVTPADAGTLSPVSGMYNEGTEVELKATPNQEYVFKNWTGDASGNVNPLKIIMLDDKNITAVFEKVNYALTLDIIGEGTVNQEIVLDKSTSKDYESGTIVRLTAVPDDEWRFVEWSGDHTGTENPIQLTMDQAMSVTAKFEKVTYTLTIETEGNGTVNKEIIQAKSTTDYDSGTIVRLTAIPDEGWMFVGWTGDHTGTLNPIQITMDQAMSVTAKFEMDLSVRIIIWVFGNGSVEKEWVGDPTLGDSKVRLTAKAQEGSYFVHFWGIPDNNDPVDLLTTENPVEFDLNEVLWIRYTDQLFLAAFFKDGVADKTHIPDDHFEQALIDLGYDDQLDDYVSTQVVSRIEELDVSNRNIQDLSGLEDFLSLQMLNCSQNNIKNLKLPKIPVYKLNLQDNELTDLDLSEIGEILSLDIRNNLLTCVQVNEAQLEQIENPDLAIWYRDEGVEFSLECEN